MPKPETQNILLNNLGNKHNLKMKFIQFIQYYKIKSVNNVAWKLVPGPF